MGDPTYEAMARGIIYGVQQTGGPIEIDVTPVANQALLKKTIQDKGYDVGQTVISGRVFFVVSLPKRRFYPIIDNLRTGL